MTMFASIVVNCTGHATLTLSLAYISHSHPSTLQPLANAANAFSSSCPRSGNISYISRLAFLKVRGFWKPRSSRTGTSDSPAT